MRWRGREQSRNIEDRRRGGARPVGLGLGGLVIVALLALFFGVDPSTLMESATDAGRPSLDSARAPESPEEAELREFASVVLRDTERTWGDLFAGGGGRYAEPTLVIFDREVRSACGYQTAAVGPFYCPADSEVYLDLSFFQELERRFGAPGDFARAYVIAHEIGHHVQNLTGVSSEVARARGTVSSTRANWLSVLQELQADCLAGVWAYHASASRGLLEPGDLEEGIAAAAAIGDDRIQMRARGRVVPESFTHGSSEQRVRWFRRGARSGEPADCDTFAADGL